LAKLKRVFSILVVLFSFIESKAVVITVSGINSDFNIRQLVERAGGELEITPVGKVGDTPQFRFNIPDKDIVLTSKGKIDLWRSLEKWRSTSPRGVGSPYTDRSSSEAIAYFPYYVNDEKLDENLESANDTYLALPFLVERKNTHPNLKFTADNGKEVSTTIPVSGIISKLNALEGKTVSCNYNSGKAEECFVCNCANEAMGEDRIGRININRTVLRRIQGVDYPNTVCGVIWQKSQFSWTLTKKGKHPYMTFPTLSGDNLKECIAASKDAVNQGAWQYDSFYNPAIASPAWRKWKGETHKNHRFVKNPKFRVQKNATQLIQRALGEEVKGVQ
jgi:hypothetical protein